MSYKLSQLSQNSRVQPSILIKQQFEVQIDHMSKQSFKAFDILSRCQTHIIPKQLICLNQKCIFFNRIICNDCQHCTHNLVSINKIIPSLNQWIFKENQAIQQQNKKLTEEWKVVGQNIKYCIDIFQELLKIIDSHIEKKLYSPNKFVDIVNIAFGMFTRDSNNQNPQMFLKSWNQLHKKYNLFHQDKQNQKSHTQNNHSWININCEALNHQKTKRLAKAFEANTKSKKFSEKALAFSQTLAQLIESKIKQEQIKIKIKQIKFKNDLCLKELLQKCQSSKNISSQQQIQDVLEKVQTFSFELGSKQGLTGLSEQDFAASISQIQKLRNLRELRINNKNGKIDHKLWYHILNYVQMLKFLKDLKISVSQKQLNFLTNLFKQKQKSVRQIQSVTIQITDEKQLNLQQLLELLNTLQLRKLNLILTRNNLEHKKVTQFLKRLKIYTSLSQLPLIQLSINISANKIHPDQKIKLQKQFKDKCKDIKIKSLII